VTAPGGACWPRRTASVHHPRRSTTGADHTRAASPVRGERRWSTLSVEPAASTACARDARHVRRDRAQSAARSRAPSQRPPRFVLDARGPSLRGRFRLALEFMSSPSSSETLPAQRDRRTPCTAIASGLLVTPVVIHSIGTSASASGRSSPRSRSTSRSWTSVGPSIVRFAAEAARPTRTKRDRLDGSRAVRVHRSRDARRRRDLAFVVRRRGRSDRPRRRRAHATPCRALLALQFPLGLQQPARRATAQDCRTPPTSPRPCSTRRWCRLLPHWGGLVLLGALTLATTTVVSYSRSSGSSASCPRFASPRLREPCALS
jgi:hypothetical protein